MLGGVASSNSEHKPLRLKMLEPEIADCLLATSEIYLNDTREIQEEVSGLSKNDNLLVDIKIPLKALYEIFPGIERDTVTTVKEALSYYIDLIKPVFALPLHLCLSRYEQGSRYPDSLRPSQQDIESIDEGLKAVEDMTETVGNLVPFLLSRKGASGESQSDEA